MRRCSRVRVLQSHIKCRRLDLQPIVWAEREYADMQLLWNGFLVFFSVWSHYLVWKVKSAVTWPCSNTSKRVVNFNASDKSFSFSIFFGQICLLNRAPKAKHFTQKQQRRALASRRHSSEKHQELRGRCPIISCTLYNWLIDSLMTIVIRLRREYFTPKWRHYCGLSTGLIRRNRGPCHSSINYSSSKACSAGH